MLVEKTVWSSITTDFEKHINNYCEQYHLETGVPRQQICKIMVEMFRGKVEGGKSDDWMRKRIDGKYKEQYRVRNVKQKKISRLDRIKHQIKKLEGDLLEASHEVSIQAKKDF